MSDRDERQAEDYDPPQVEDVPAEDGPAITAAGVTRGDNTEPGPEWRPNGDAEEESE